MSSATESTPLSVSQAMALAKNALESCTVTLVGEVSEVSVKPGYKAAYFTVKDTAASMPCMMWMNRFRSEGIDLRVGQLVQLTGRFTVYAPKGRMNFDVFSLSAAGEGDLRQRVADLARRLSAEGLMEASRKCALPGMPRTIGLVTSPHGAAVHDVLRTLRRRWPLSNILLAGVMVEGVNAPAEIVEGLRVVVEAGAEVVLLVRGGGSFEDLMPFNDERLARTIARCPVPVVTGIGHEPDTSIADMVADRRASTPTAAAEACVPDQRELALTLDASADRLQAQATVRLADFTRRLDALASRPVLSDPLQAIARFRQPIDLVSGRLTRAIPGALAADSAALAAHHMRLRAIGSSLTSMRVENLTSSQSRLSTAGRSLQTRFDEAWQMRAARLGDLSPLSVIGRGFALVRDDTGALVHSIDTVSPGTKVSIAVADGTIDAQVTATTHDEKTTVSWEEKK